MNGREVALEIVGRHFRDGAWEETSTACDGKYYERDGTHYLFYTEERTRTRVTFRAQSLLVKREGAVNTEIPYELGKVSETLYSTPFGDFLMTTECMMLSFERKEDKVRIYLEYRMSLGGEEPQDATLDIRFEPAGNRG